MFVQAKRFIPSARRNTNAYLGLSNSRYEYKSAYGNFSLQILGVASELEVGLTAERIREMKRGKALTGRRVVDLLRSDIRHDRIERTILLRRAFPPTMQIIKLVWHFPSERRRSIRQSSAHGFACARRT